MADRLENFKAVLLVTLGFGLFSLNDAIIKLLAQTYSIPQTLFWTSFFVCLVLFVYAGALGKLRGFKTQETKWHFLRGVLMALMIGCNIFALIKLQITDFYVIVFTAPMVVSLTAWLFLKDKLKKRQITTISAGFLVILYICRPDGELFNIGALSAITGVVFFSLATLLVRSKLREENPLLISMNGPAVTAIIALPLMAWFGFVVPASTLDMILFLICGAAAAFGGVFFSMGFQRANSAAVVAPLHYTQIVWGALLGYAIFREIPNQEVIVGAILLAGLGIYLIVTEARMRHHTPAENENLVQHGPV